MDHVDLTARWRHFGPIFALGKLLSTCLPPLYPIFDPVEASLGVLLLPMLPLAGHPGIAFFKLVLDSR